MTYGGDNIFGLSVICVHVQRPSEVQLNAFFGTSGVQRLWGGGRGRVFLINGFLAGSDMSDLTAAEANFRSYDDGIARVLTDTWGRSWPRVVYGHMEPTDRVMRLAGGLGLGFPYRATFEGLI